MEYNRHIKKIKEKGSIIIYTLMILSAVMMISIALFRVLIPKFLIVREAVYSAVSIYAADSAVELCLFTTRVNTSAWTVKPTQSRLVAYYSIPDVTIQTNPLNCSYQASGSASIRAVGSYKGISRSLEIF